MATAPRRLLAACAVLGTCIALTAPGSDAKAQGFEGHAPWCANMGGEGPGWECDYYTFEQCMARASGITNSCNRNPFLVQVPPPVVRGPVRAPRHRHDRYRDDRYYR